MGVVARGLGVDGGSAAAGAGAVSARSTVGEAIGGGSTGGSGAGVGSFDSGCRYGSDVP